jgi:uncharacterized protein
MRDPRPAASAPYLLSILLVFLALAALPAAAVTVEEIPSPRPTGWSVDRTGRISRERLAAIDRVGDEVQAKSGGELAVVVVGTTDGVPSREFATRLFNRWGIGQKGKDNGVLLFLALDDRKAEVVLGNGFANPNLREVSASILEGHIVPLLRQGDPGRAAVAGARAAAWQLFSVALTSPLPASPGTEAISPPAAPAPAPVRLAAPALDPAVPPTVLGGLGRIIAMWAGLAVLGLLGWGGYKLATRPRLCPRCRTAMERLPPEAVAAQCTPVEQLEDRLGSVTTQIFQCPGCGELEKVRRRAAFSRYQSCPSCEAITVSETQRTMREASYDEEGIVQSDWRCENCDYRDSSTSWIPRRVRPTVRDTSYSYSSSSSPSYDSSSSSSSDSSSSSSSSDSGFSGGSSSGDGASASW